MLSPEHIPFPSFAGHESFPLRYGWLTKGVSAARGDTETFSRDDALVGLGVGKNMVRSIRHWCLSASVLEEGEAVGRRRGVRPSWLGSLLLGPRGLDPYLEDPATLWLIHWQLASRRDGPTTWFWAFNGYNEAEFTKEKLLGALKQFVERSSWKRVAASSLSRDVDCFIRTYVPSRTTRTLVLEETLDCPLAELGLIQDIDGGRTYAFNRGDHPTLPTAVVIFSLLSFWDSVAEKSDTLTFDQIAYQPGSPGRVFKLTENALTERLESIERLTGKAIGFDATAGLRQLYRRKPVEEAQRKQILRDHYSGPKGGRR